MEENPEPKNNFLHKLSSGSPLKVLVAVLAAAVLGGLGSGYYLASSQASSGAVIPLVDKPKSASQDNRTFRDFAEGKITKKPEPKNPQAYQEGTHLLIRDGAVPVALTSSVVDLSQFENKKVKVYGETQKALSVGWLMDVGKIEAAK